MFKTLYPPEDKQPEPKRNPTTRDKLRKAAICKTRYGRASLTIRRWGGLGSLLHDDDLGRAIESFRNRTATAETVAWAFVRDRVKEHSRTFSWDGADLDRLVRLVVECSRSPELHAKDATELAEELVQVQREERQQFEKLAKDLARSFEGISRLSQLFANSALLSWSDQNRRALRELSQTVAGSWQTSGWNDAMRAAGLSAGGRSGFPALQANIADHQALFAQRITLPHTAHDALRKSLFLSSTQLRGATLLAPSLGRLAQSNTFTIGEVLEAAQEASTAVELQGAEDEAAQINAIAADVVEVVEQPSLERLEAAVGELSSEIKSVSQRLDEAKKDRNVDREEGEKHRRDAVTLQVYLWLLAILLAYFTTLIENLTEGG